MGLLAVRDVPAREQAAPHLMRGHPVFRYLAGIQAAHARGAKEWVAVGGRAGVPARRELKRKRRAFS